MENKSTQKILVYSIIDIIILSVGQMLNQTGIVVGAIIVFCLILIFSSIEYFLPIMLFYLPWSPILKYAPGTNTIYTLIVMGVFLKLLLKRKDSADEIKIPIPTFIIALLFTILTMVGKLVLTLPIDNSYFMFIFMLMFTPIYIEKIRDTVDFKILVLFLCVGIISSCVSAQILMQYPHMLEYIDVYDLEKGLVRLSGFYGDANFYSAQILAAISGIMIVLSKTTKVKHEIIQIISIVVLIFMGMLSVSKMFIICLAVIILLWFLSTFTNKKNMAKRLGIVAFVLFVVVFIVISGIFSTQINYYIYRFGSVENNADLTTGRSIIWESYISYFSTEMKWLCFGECMTESSSILGSASHNTFIQLIYQCGVIGTILLAIYWKIILNKFVKFKLSYDPLGVIILIFACFAPWFALDMVYFDEFFYITLFFICGLKFIHNNQTIFR